jgi:endonuclease/exonuclease/phosphatase family metal-dependent hydrolase
MYLRTSSHIILLALLSAVAAPLTGCGDQTDPLPALPDGGTSDGGGTDGGPSDAGADATADGGIPDAGPPFDAGPPAPLVCDGGAPITARLVAGNISSGNLQSYSPGDGGRIFKALKGDVVMIQEFNYNSNSDADVRGFVTRYFGAEFSYMRGTGQIPNGVISRFPILASGEWVDASVSNRAFVWAKIDLPGPRDLVAVSVHLLTSSSGNRATEANQLKGYLQANVTDGSFIAVGGDFNTDSRSETALNNFSAILSTGSPYPADQKGNDGTNTGRTKPYDWLIVSPSLQARRVNTQLGSVGHPNGAVFDSRVFSPISSLNTAGDPDALTGGESAASNMQHMAVVRDFAVDCP